MVNVLADKYLYNIQAYLPESINLQLFDPAQGLPTAINKAHALLVRTVIPINKQTLPHIPSQLQFIGTGSSGTDHIDQQYLEKHDIHFADAAGCNARSVAEYIATTLLIWSQQRNKDLTKLSVGIVGAGHAGTQVIDILHKMKIPTVAYDPPRAERETDFNTASLKEVLAADILSFHTPLSRTGKYPTFHWLDESRLKDQLFQLVINAARGGVIDERALLSAMKQGKIRDAIIDTWENEPEIRLDTAGAAFIKTPHIAGYSIQAKQNASKFIAEDLINYFNLALPKHTNTIEEIIFDDKLSNFDTLSSLLMQLHPAKEYERRLDTIIKKYSEKRGEQFNKLRAEYPLRQQFKQIYLPRDYFETYPILKTLGFSSSANSK